MPESRFLIIFFIKKETLVQVFSCEFCKVFNDIFLYGPPPGAGSGDFQQITFFSRF